MAKRKSQRQCFKYAKDSGLMTNEKGGKAEDDHVSVSHPRVLRKVENVEGVEVSLKHKWRDSEFEMKFCGILYNKSVICKLSPRPGV